jgi:hypothetical protein
MNLFINNQTQSYYLTDCVSCCADKTVVVNWRLPAASAIFRQLSSWKAAWVGRWGSPGLKLRSCCCPTRLRVLMVLERRRDASSEEARSCGTETEEPEWMLVSCCQKS